LLAERAGKQEKCDGWTSAGKLMQDPERPYQAVWLFFEPQPRSFEPPIRR
jgi:hypothetical protein